VIDQPSIFLCHSSKDDAVVVEFRAHLDPLFHLCDLRIWDDSELFAGRPWHENIQAQLKTSIAAIILVSPGLLDSDYVRSHEIPVFLGIAQSTRLPIYCLYLAYSVVDQIFFYPSTQEASEPVKLTEYQGLNSPEEPLPVIKRQRNKVLRDAAIKVYNDLRERGLIQSNMPRRLIGIVDREPTLGRRTLYVRVETRKPHPKYGQVVRKDKTYPVHWNEDVEIHVNDRVEVRECRPRSKTKKHELVRKLS
jgi:small subunit ribosomal protein S17